MEVACLEVPWSGAVVLRLIHPLPLKMANTGAGTAAWAIELANGARCVLTTGANGRLDSVALIYGCQSENSAGGLDTAAEPWTVEYLHVGTNHLVKVDVTAAWAG